MIHFLRELYSTCMYLYTCQNANYQLFLFNLSLSFNVSLWHAADCSYFKCSKSFKNLHEIVSASFWHMGFLCRYYLLSSNFSFCYLPWLLPPCKVWFLLPQGNMFHQTFFVQSWKYYKKYVKKCYVI